MVVTPRFTETLHDDRAILARSRGVSPWCTEGILRPEGALIGVVVMFLAGDTSTPIILGGVWSKTDFSPEPNEDGSSSRPIPARPSAIPPNTGSRGRQPPGRAHSMRTIHTGRVATMIAAITIAVGSATRAPLEYPITLAFLMPR